MVDSLVLHRICSDNAYDLKGMFAQDQMARMSSALQDAVTQCIKAKQQGHLLRHVQDDGGDLRFVIFSFDHNVTRLGRQRWALSFCMLGETDDSQSVSAHWTVERPDGSDEEMENPQNEYETGSVQVSGRSTEGDGTSISQDLDFSKMTRSSGI